MKATKTIGIVSIIAGIIMIVAGAFTYGTVAAQLKAENITVPNDAEFMGGMFKGKQVAGPLSAYAQADIINHHALAGTEGKTYAELGALANKAKDENNQELADKYTQQRQTVMNASFLRSSLFSSVIAFGVAALVMGLGLLFGLVGWALTSIRPADAK
ncbi:MAG: aromatic ring-opening dioxygenase LigA [Arachnia sp.]